MMCMCQKVWKFRTWKRLQLSECSLLSSAVGCNANTQMLMYIKTCNEFIHSVLDKDNESKPPTKQ
eukprot:m.100725 g.100725  ORF g.100725 m.100725 type:complete len:65 (+) comp12554_c0_seq12:823-1017(+)